MAFVLIPGPGDTPETTEDWDKINNVLLGIGMGLLSSTRVVGTNVKRGSIVFFAGSWYVTDADTAITGTPSDYVRLTSTAGVVSAAFVSALTAVSFNRTWNGWYDSSMRLFIFDEVKAFASGAVTELASMTTWRPNVELSRVLSTAMTSTWADALVHTLDAQWSTALQRNLITNQLARMFGLGTMTTLTGSGTYTVPTGVYRLHVKMIGPGQDGTDATPGSNGISGWSGQELDFDMDVTPTQEIAYTITDTSTTFGVYTAAKGGWIPPSTSYGGGIKAGKFAGGHPGDADATDGYGGGGGGGVGPAAPVGQPNPPSAYGGDGGLGTIILS